MVFVLKFSDHDEMKQSELHSEHTSVKVFIVIR